MAVALTEVTVCFGGRALTQQLLRDPAAMTRITSALLAEQAAMCDQLIQIARRPALQRVAHVLADLFTRIQNLPPRDGAEIDLPLTQEQIGDYLGLTAIHVNRMLAQLRRAGAAAVRRRKLRILNAQRLLTLAEGEYQAAPRARRVEQLAAAA
jgi:CRP-like cAMP-binding protein